MNHPETLGFYTELQLFLNNHQLGDGATLQFPTILTPSQRRTVRSLAEKLNLNHMTHGIASERYITVGRSTSPHPEPIAELSVPSITSPDLSRLSLGPYPPARSIQSEDRLNLSELRSPIAPTPRLRTVASMGNLRGDIPPDPSTMPPLPRLPQYDLLQYDPFNPQGRQSLVHRSSQESTVSQGTSRGYMLHATRQPIGPPQDHSRGFTGERPREAFGTIRPIGHGAKTPSHGSLSHGSSRESRGGSDQSALELQIQQGSHPHHHPSEFQ
jgi:hypothetical protein